MLLQAASNHRIASETAHQEGTAINLTWAKQ